MSTQITDPADRLGWAGDGSGEEFVKALEERYCGLTPAEPAPVADFDSRYAAVCDLAVQLLWPERYQATPDDPFLHTSDPARAIARLFFVAAGIEPDAP